MIKSFVNVSLSKNLTEDIAKSLQELANKTVCIGIPQEGNVQVTGGDITNAQLLYIHTHGIRNREMRQEMQENINDGMEYSEAHDLYVHEHGSPLHNSPPRPVLVPALDDSREVMAELMRDAAIEILDGKNVNLELAKVGQEGRNIARDWFTDPANNWAPNSPKTIEKKGSANPLIDSGELRKSITWTIKDGDRND